MQFSFYGEILTLETLFIPYPPFRAGYIASVRPYVHTLAKTSSDLDDTSFWGWFTLIALVTYVPYWSKIGLIPHL